MEETENQEFQMFDQIQEPVLVLDGKNRPVYFNHIAVTTFRAPPRIFRKAKGAGDIFTEKSKELEQAVEKVRKKDLTFISSELEIVPKNGTGENYVMVVKLFPQRIGRRKYVVLCFKDLSVEKRLYSKYRDQLEELRKNHGDIIQADKVSTLGELTAGISHEISNPLTIAIGNLEVVKEVLANETLQEKEVINGCIGNALEAIDRINKIIVGMKSFLHRSEDKREYCEIEKIIDDSIKLMSSAFAGSKVTLSKKVYTREVIGYVNPVKLQQVLVNLLKNSLDAVSENEGEKKVAIAMDRSPDGQNINVMVEDNGPGLSRDEKKHIFDAFYTTKKMGEGTGLGLSISKKIVESHNGTIWVDSEKGVGSVFRVQLPCIEVSSFTFNERYLNGLQDAEDVKILVVDDEVEVLNVLGRMFEEEQLVFIGSNNGEKALKVLGDMPIDLIITDYTMPDMAGAEFAELVRKAGHQCPILYMSSAGNMDKFKRDQQRYGVAGMIIKPFSKNEVMDTIRSVIEGRKKL